MRTITKIRVQTNDVKVECETEVGPGENKLTLHTLSCNYTENPKEKKCFDVKKKIKIPTSASGVLLQGKSCRLLANFHGDQGDHADEGRVHISEEEGGGAGAGVGGGRGGAVPKLTRTRPTKGRSLNDHVAAHVSMLDDARRRGSQPRSREQPRRCATARPCDVVAFLILRRRTQDARPILSAGLRLQRDVTVFRFAAAVGPTSSSRLEDPWPSERFREPGPASGILQEMAGSLHSTWTFGLDPLESNTRKRRTAFYKDAFYRPRCRIFGVSILPRNDANAEDDNDVEKKKKKDEREKKTTRV
ncbi:hypothetical protein EAI_01073 [Harpegnathos saltator]|uniref:Uncharacterized protein n=1 Tax=Harpegnathos saltator TaxID=610380 RepID=E2B8Y9_HARSA|nr:hypothetical protein EAI_01073 [Harpegnathos saltator]